ncbi:hypothetical protein TELCIR_11227 [Teladorsagia circumcincta]|uniref:Protein kinase domain-containing protein n=1 Tax=Teladorsagia circumcincta TaxID=45464 RepID=A0A2G9U9U3_TELCI|nr:hypothetical protein TELCIR_11227 [Teladorsagia circumcincta]
MRKEEETKLHYGKREKNSPDRRHTEVLFKKAIRLAKWEFTPQSVQVGKLLSTGAFGEIRQGKLTKKDGSVVDVAVKMV